jgi:hypothetical protein
MPPPEGWNLDRRTNAACRVGSGQDASTPSGGNGDDVIHSRAGNDRIVDTTAPP